MKLLKLYHKIDLYVVIKICDFFPINKFPNSSKILLYDKKNNFFKKKKNSTSITFNNKHKN